MRRGRVKLGGATNQRRGEGSFRSVHQKRQIIGTKKTAMTKNQAMQTMPIFQ